MGLIKAFAGALSNFSETWKDYFVCDAMDNDVLMVRGVKNGGSGSGEIITNGSRFVVADGQCALIVSEGNILSVANEPGGYTVDDSTSPSIFDGGFTGIANSFKDALERFTYGGEVNKNQRLYYINTKEVMGNLFGTATPVPFRIIDRNIGLDVEFPIRCNGDYSFKIVDPVVFYQKVAGNKADYFKKDELTAQMKAEVLNALQPAFSTIAAAGVRYSEVPAHVEELAQAMRDALATKWTENRGIAFDSIAINSISMDPENEKKLADLQMTAVNKDAAMANATLVSAVKDAANNPNGATAAFMNMNMASNAAAGMFQQNANTGPTKYCTNCGTQVPAEANFCSNCGTKLN